MSRPTMGLAISGRTRAGKTTLAQALACELGWPWSSFSAYVRAQARERALPETRAVLQDLGAELLNAGGGRGLAKGALEHGGALNSSSGFIIEGVRHEATLAGLRGLLDPTPVYLVFLDVSDAERNRRLAAEGITAEEGVAWERHSTEHEVLTRLSGLADIVVDADMTRENVLNCALSFVTSLRAS